MKKKLSLLATPVFLFAFSATSYALNDCIVPYIGGDFQIRHIGFKKDFGNNLFKKNNPQGNVYLGLMLNEFIGIEAGFEYSWKRTSHVANTAGAIELGDIPIQVGQVNFSNNTQRLSGPHASIIGFIPFCVCDQKFEIFGSIGAVHLRAKLKTQPTAFLTPEGFVEIPAEELAVFRNTFKKSKTVLKAGLGLNYMMHECAGLRLGVTWENTSRFKAIRARAIDVEGRVKMRDSVVYSLGIFWRFH